MERVGLKAKLRDRVGKGAARTLRRNGLVPGVLYGRGRDPMPVSVEARALHAALHTHAGQNVLIDLGLEGGDGETATVMVREVQRDIFRHHATHVDFHAISLTETIETHVPIVLIGTCRGVSEGGILEYRLREVVVECLPTQIPEQLELDVTDLVIGRALHASDLVVPEGVTLVTQVEDVLVTVSAPRVHEEAAAPEAAQGVPAEAAPAEAEEAPEAG